MPVTEWDSEGRNPRLTLSVEAMLHRIRLGHVAPTPMHPPGAPSPPAPARQLLFALGLTTLAVWICYAWLDRPIAWFVHDHALPRIYLLLQLTHLPDGIVVASAIVLLLAPLRVGFRRPVGRGERVLLGISASVALAVFVKNFLKFVFGRAWPETWIDHNPSLIHDHVYGFFWFQSSPGFHSFPSGHTTVTFAAMSVLWLWLPARWRWLPVVPCALVIVGLLGMDYHFLGDVVAGAFMGSVCGMYVYRWMVVTRR